MVCKEIRCVFTRRSVSHRLQRVVKTNRNLIYDFATILSYVKYSTQPRNGLIHRLQEWYSRLRYHFIASRHILRSLISRCQNWNLSIQFYKLRFTSMDTWNFILGFIDFLYGFIELLILFLSGFYRRSLHFAFLCIYFYNFSNFVFIF